jgi:hypothetical protein
MSSAFMASTFLGESTTLLMVLMLVKSHNACIVVGRVKKNIDKNYVIGSPEQGYRARYQARICMKYGRNPQDPDYIFHIKMVNIKNARKFGSIRQPTCMHQLTT